MIRFPSAHLPDAFAGTVLEDWLSARSVYAALCDAARPRPDATAVTFIAEPEAPIGEARRLSYRGLVEGVIRAANLFRSLGIGRRDVVAYLLPSLVETQFVLWGAETAGIALPVNPLLQAEDIAAMLVAAGAKVLVALGPVPGADTWHKAVRVQALAPCVKTLVKLGGGAVPEAGVVDFAAALAHCPAVLAFEDLPGPADTAACFHTGGTTGAPKLVIHTHQNQLAAAYGGACHAGLDGRDILVNGLPMFHVAAAIFGSLSVLLAGGQVVILTALGFRHPQVVPHFWRMVADTRATLVAGVPTALGAVLQTPAEGLDLSAVRLNVVGAAATPRSVAQGLEAVTGRPVHEVYGMTEAGGVICVDPVSRGRVLGSASHPIPFCQVQARVLLAGGGCGAPCEAGQAGVLVARGPNISPGYLGATGGPGLFTADGWLVTGDVGYVEAGGRVFVTGRAKDLIIRSGHNIDPQAIESCLLQHPGVAQAAAVGMLDAYAGEVPVAYVTPRPGADLAEDALLAFAQAHIAERPALPRRIFVWDALPLTSIGKVYKPALRQDCNRQWLAQLLADEGLGPLVLRDDPRRGRVLVVKPPAGGPLAVGRTGDPQQRARVEARLAPYLLTVEWED